MLELTDAATGVAPWLKCWVIAGTWLELYDWATAAVRGECSAQNTIALSQSEHTARPWYVSAETPIQIATLE